jgi:ABC-type glutathione transport system ATPase component
VPSLLEVKGLTVRFRTQYGQVQALTDAHFDLDYGETLVLVGESGSGKTVLAHALMRLLPMNAAVEGAVRLAGEDLLKLDEGKMRAYRGQRMSLIPQSPGASLNPVRRLGTLLMEAAKARGGALPAHQVALRGRPTVRGNREAIRTSAFRWNAATGGQRPGLGR